MKLDMKTLKTVYLFGDGHAACVHSKNDRRAGTVYWVELHEKLVPTCYFKEGRIIFGSIYEFSSGPAGLLSRTKSVEVKKPCLEEGSKNSKELGIKIGTLTLKGNDFSVRFHEMPDFLSGGYDYQEEDRWSEKWEDVKDSYSWGSYNVSKKHLAEKE